MVDLSESGDEREIPPEGTVPLDLQKLSAASVVPAETLESLVFSFGPTLEQVRELSDSVVRASAVSIDVSEALKPRIRAFAAIPDALSCTLPKIDFNLSRFSEALLKTSITADAFAQFSDQLQEYFDSLFEELKLEIPEVDWGLLRKGHKVWGRYGWLVYDSFPYSYVASPPSSQKEADSLALYCIRRKELSAIVEDLRIQIPKHRDLDEAIWLFEQKHYKPCAMMLFSLIECELFKADVRMNGRANNKANRPLNQIRKSDGAPVAKALEAEGAFRAHAYFFENGDNFNRSREGEINRNFLMHGMMYKPVTRRACIKLLILLHGLGRILHEP